MSSTSFGDFMTTGEFIRKLPMWTQSSEQIMIIHDETDLKESQITVKVKQPRPDLKCQRVGPVNPTYKPAGLWGPPSGLSFVRQFPTASKIESTPLLKVGLYRGSRWSVAMDSWAHRSLGAPYKRTRYLLQKGILILILGSELAIKRRIVLHVMSYPL
jgi:hypothetical protein